VFYNNNNYYSHYQKVLLKQNQLSTEQRTLQDPGKISSENIIITEFFHTCSGERFSNAFGFYNIGNKFLFEKKIGRT
jgi:hypothetical protein